MVTAKWIERDGAIAVVSPAAECVHILSAPARAHGIKSKGMRKKREGKALVERNDYVTYCMDDVAPIPDYKLVFQTKGQFNGIRVHYNLRTDPDLGVGWVALRCVACGCGPCKEQLQTPWVPRVDCRTQPHNAQNERCLLWPSYKGVNDGRFWSLSPRSQRMRRGHESQSNAH
jgi:hypothetical protein